MSWSWVGPVTTRSQPCATANSLTRTVTTNAELEEAMAAIKAEPDHAASIDVVVPAEVNVSLPDKVIDHIYKLKTPHALPLNP